MEKREVDFFTELHFLYRKGKIDKLKSKCAKILELHPECSEAWVFQGICLKSEQMYVEAADCLNKGLELDSDDLYAIVHRCHMEVIYEKFDLAKDDLDYLVIYILRVFTID